MGIGGVSPLLYMSVFKGEPINLIGLLGKPCAINAPQRIDKENATESFWQMVRKAFIVKYLFENLVDQKKQIAVLQKQFMSDEVWLA